MKKNARRSRERGSIAMEYVLISAFTAIASVAAIGYVSKIMKEKLVSAEEKLGIQLEPEGDLWQP